MKLTYFASAVNSSILNITYKSKDMDYDTVGINTAYPVYKFTVTFNDSSLHYQQCKFTSEMYGPLTFSRIRHFQGFTEQCNFGGFLLSEDPTGPAIDDRCLLHIAHVLVLNHY